MTSESHAIVVIRTLPYNLFNFIFDIFGGLFTPSPMGKNFTWFRVYDDRFGGFIRPKPSRYTTKRLKSVITPTFRQLGPYQVQEREKGALRPINANRLYTDE